MKRYLTVAGVTATTAVFGCLPSVAFAKQPTHRHLGVYRYLRHRVIEKFGEREPGRNIVRDGMRSGRKANDSDIVASNTVMERMLAPPPKPQPVATTSESSSSYESDDTSSDSSYSDDTDAGTSMPTCTWEPESGGDPTAVNASSGAGGYYQIMPSTWAAYGGTGAPQDAPMSEQTAIAQKIYEEQGPSAWTNC